MIALSKLVRAYLYCAAYSSPETIASLQKDIKKMGEFCFLLNREYRLDTGEVCANIEKELRKGYQEGYGIYEKEDYSFEIKTDRIIWTHKLVMVKEPQAITFDTLITRAEHEQKYGVR